MECVVYTGVTLYCDEFIPIVYPQFLEGNQVFEYFFEVVCRFTLLSDHFVVFLSAYSSL